MTATEKAAGGTMAYTAGGTMAYTADGISHASKVMLKILQARLQ